MAKLDLKKTIRGLNFFTRKLRFFGGVQKTGDQFIFDQRGAIRITEKEITTKDGEIVKIRGIADSGSGSSMVIPRPGAGQRVTPSAAMDSYHGWVYACVKAIADEISNTEFRVYKVNSKGEHEELDSHPLIDFLDTVNDFQTGPEFKHILASHLELAGNAYILLGDVTDEDSKPKFMFLLDPSKVKIFLDKTSLPYRISHYIYTFDSKEWSFKPYQIIQIKYPNPSDPYLGLGTVQGIAEWIDNDSNSTQFLKEFFQNGAQVGVTFETDMSSEDQLHELKESFNEQHAGIGNAFKAMFLPKGVKKPSNDIKFGDIAFDEISSTSRDRILAGFRVSKTILGAAESETNRATAETADYVFSRRTIKPKIQLICSYLNEFLVPRFGDDIYLTFIDPVPEDMLTKTAEMRNAVGSLPVLTADEARERYLDLPAVAGGDKLLTPNNYVPAENAGEYTQPYMLSAEQKSKKIKSKVGYIPPRTGKNKTQFSRNMEIRKDLSKAISEKVAEAFLANKKKSVKNMTKEEYEEVVLKAKRDRTVKYAEQMRDELKKINEKQKAEVLGNLDNAIKSVKAVDEDKLFNKDKWVNIVIDSITPIAKDLFVKESEQALEIIDGPGFDVENSPAAQTAIKNAMDLMSESYNQSTLDMLKEKINQGLEEGLSMNNIAVLVQDIYEWKNQIAAERVALTESNRIANEASKISWKESGLVKEVKWVTSGRDVCEFCEDMEGTTINIDEDFWEKGDVFQVGDSVMDIDYSDIGGPPLHPNCHCGIRPIVSTAIEASAEPAGQEESEEDKKIDEAIKEFKNL